VNEKFTDILRLAKVNVNKEERNSLLHELSMTGLISATLNGSYKVNFIEQGKTIIVVNDLDNMINFLPIYCDKCGKQIPKKSPKHDMCSECYKEERKIRESARNW
jgi:hypothetical protein